MPGSVKGGLFVGAAVAVGLLAAFLLPPLVVGRQPASTSAGPPPRAMPDVVGRRLDEAEDTLGRRGIAYVTDGADIFGVTVPAIMEVCETVPRPGEQVHGTARVRASLSSTCAI